MATFTSKLATAAIVAFAIGSGVPAAAEPATTASDCVAAGDVWVHVEYDDTTTGACATEFSTAQEATTSAGLTEEAGPFYTTIDGRTANGTTAREWWSLYSLPAGAGVDEWDFATVGAHELTLEGGQVVAWVLQPDWNLDAVAPAADPFAVEVPVEETPTASPSPSESPSATAAPSVTASPAPSASATPEEAAPGLPKTGV
ncbi:hypothetical protein [Tessaracoccus oleiagri]|uniref:DUF4430 domain-containing protein n=1 Tax=Tessaracoccus oleiagri TaxID=686624 RepID=A0A1G9J751_9ACTN|nr:hypothetical protein [Tessaracoccus oleiagri]SDL33122.1 hypothetical protein SAMN04488242_1066 [Tessaracoccus oleiagri]